MKNYFEKITIVIPCRNEDRFIGNSLTSIIESSYPNEFLEVLVVDGMSEDNTRQIVNTYTKKYPFIKLIPNYKKITPAALNLGIKSSTGNYIIIMSAHSSFHRNYILILYKKMAILNADVVGGIMETKVKEKNKKSLSIKCVLSNKFGVGNSMFRIGHYKEILVDTVPFGLYRKEVFYETGFYDERLIRNHDIEFSKRLIKNNKKIYLIPDAFCTYYAREKFTTLAKNNFKNGAWNIYTVYITKNLFSLSLRHFIPIGFLLSLTVPLLLAFFNTNLLWISATIFTIYNSLIISQVIKMNNSSTKFANMFWAFYTLHFSYGLGSLIGLFNLKKLFK